MMDIDVDNQTHHGLEQFKVSVLTTVSIYSGASCASMPTRVTPVWVHQKKLEIVIICN